MLIDPYKRPVNYLRVSVTDRCDFRCQYCMAEDMKFLPKKDLLTLDELERICISFIDLGTKKIRITGGEPLVRKNVMSLFKNLGSYIKKNQLSDRDRDALELMDLKLSSNWTEIHKQFRLLVKKYHPDKNHGNKKYEDKLKTITLAYTQLKKKFGKK